MSRRSATVLAAACLVVGTAAGGWAVAQREPSPSSPAAPEPAGGESYHVAPAGDSAVLVGARSGRTWVLTRSAEGGHAWLPTERIDSKEAALEWRDRQRLIAEHQRKKADQP